MLLDPRSALRAVGDDGGDAVTSRSAPPSSCCGRLETLENFAGVSLTERSAATDEVTNRFKNCKDPVGIGVVAGFNFALPSSGIVVGPFASSDWLRQTVNRTFGGGTFIGTTTHWIGTAGVRIGAISTSGAFVYGLARVSALNADLNINFGAPFVTSSNTSVVGGTLGLGAAFHPRGCSGSSNRSHCSRNTSTCGGTRRT